MKLLFLTHSVKFMDTTLHCETYLLGKFYMHQENNAPFMTKNKICIFFHGYFWDTLKKVTYVFLLLNQVK